MSVLRRTRAHGGQYALLAVLVAVTTLLITATPRLTGRLTADGLRQHLADQPAPSRDLTFYARFSLARDPDSARGFGQETLRQIEQKMPEPVRTVIGERWRAVQSPFIPTGSSDLTAAKIKVDFAVRAMPGIQRAATLVSGRWPAEDLAVDAPNEVVLSRQVAERTGLKVGSRLFMTHGTAISDSGDDDGEAPPDRVDVVGIYQAANPTDGIWDSLPTPLAIAAGPGENDPFQAVAVTSDAGIGRLNWMLTYTWRYRVDPQRIDPDSLDQLIDSIQQLARVEMPMGAELSQGVDAPLREFARSLAATRTLLAVIATGVLASLVGLSGLAALLAVRRRRSEYALIRARGGSHTALAGRNLAEALLVLPVAALTGWALGRLVPGEPVDTTTAVLAAGMVATLALPVLALTVRTGPGTERRDDLVSRRPTIRRLTAEVTVLLLAGLATFLLRRRGLATDGTVDPLLVSVPVLVAVATGLIALRFYPWPLRLLGRLATRTRGTVLFLGLARAGRASVAVPLLVVVLAVATATFSGVVARGVDAARDRAAVARVPGDVLVTGGGFAPDTAAQLAQVPGVRVVAPYTNEDRQRIFPAADRAATRIDEVSVLMVDGPTFARMVAASKVDVPVPDVLTTALRDGAPLPALVSPAVAADIADARLDTPFVGLQGGRYAFTVAGTADRFPIGTGYGERTILLPWPARPADAARPLTPTGFLLAGATADPTALRQVADEGRKRHRNTGLVTGGQAGLGAEVRTRAGVRADLGGGGVNGLLFFAYTGGAAGAVLFGLLAIAFVVLAGARSRAAVLSRLRTLGLSGRQWRGMLALELAPLVGVSVLTGAVAGVLLPILLAPVLGLTAFTGGVDVAVGFDPLLVAGVVAMAAVALGFALAVEALNNRRMRLGDVLRIDRGDLS